MTASETLQKPGLPRWALWLALAALVGALVVVMARVWPLGADYYYHFRPVSEKWLAGETRLYDGRTPPFLNAPWALVVLAPLALLPLNLAQAVLNVTSLVLMVASLHALREDKPIPLYALVLALANLNTFDVLIRGALDAFPLLGVALGYWAVRTHRPLALSLGFWLMAIKPPNVILPALLYLYGIRDWPLSDWLRALSLPVLSALACGFVIGFDWPLRIVQSSQTAPANPHLSTSLWRGASQIGLPTWPLWLFAALALTALAGLAVRVGVSDWSLSVALATSLVITPYANDNHFVLLIPAFLYAARADWRLALLAYAASWTPLVRLAWGYGAAPVDSVYPLLLLATSWAVGLRHTRPTDGPLPLPS